MGLEWEERACLASRSSWAQSASIKNPKQKHRGRTYILSEKKKKHNPLSSLYLNSINLGILLFSPSEK